MIYLEGFEEEADDERTSEDAGPAYPAAPTVAEKITELGLGMYQLQALLLVCGFFTVQGVAIISGTSLARTLDLDWGMTNAQRGLMVSIIFVGLAVGCGLSGPIADSYGRRPTICWAYLGAFVTLLAMPC